MTLDMIESDGITNEDWADQDWASFFPTEFEEETPEQEAAWALLETENHKDEKHQERLANCGKQAYFFNPLTGKQQGYVFYCDLFRECPRCLDRRAKKTYKRVVDLIIKKDKIHTAMVDHEEARNLLRRLGANKNQFSRFPMDDGNDLLLLDLSELSVDRENVAFVKIDIDWIMAQDWRFIMNTPDGTRKSGMLHIPPPGPEKEETVQIAVPEFVTSAVPSEVAALMEKIVKETANFKPTNAEEVKAYLWQRVMRAVRELESRGHYVGVYIKMHKIAPSKIAWENSGEISNVNTNYLTRDTTRNPVPIPILTG